MTRDPTTAAPVLCAALAGAATGCRSQSALAACALSGIAGRQERGPAGYLDALLGRPSVRWMPVVSICAELVVDKLPQAPNRTSPPALAVRLLLGAVTAGMLAARFGPSQRVAAAVGLLAAAATSCAGARVRAESANWFGSDLPGALAEDVLALGLAFAATRPR